MLKTLCLTVVISLVLVGCGKDQKKGVSCKGPTLQAFGDSHAAGSQASSPTRTGYVVPLASRLGLCLENHAVGGTGITEQLGEIEAHGHTYTEFKILMPGFNDARISLPIPEFQAKLSQAITALSGSSKITLIGTPPRYSPTYTASYVPDSVLYMYRDAVQGVVASLGFQNVVLVNVTDTFNYPTAYLAPDQVHFNDQGSGVLANLFFMALPHTM